MSHLTISNNTNNPLEIFYAILYKDSEQRILSLEDENHVTYNFRDSSLFLMGRMCLKTKSITEKHLRGESELGQTTERERERQKGVVGVG